MSKEEGEVGVGVGVGRQRRKSARILALEEEKKKEKQKRNSAAISKNNNISRAILSGINGSSEYQQQLHQGLVLSRTTSTMPPPPPPPLLKRGRKQKRLEDLVLSSLVQNSSQKDGENTKDGNTSTRNDQQPITALPSVQWIPEEGILEFVLDILQRRDTHKIFAQPVDPEEVETYYAIIKDPMDFGTMRTKLQEGKYTNLEQFEGDVFLMCNNAMHFNSSVTIYYKEARGLKELAQLVFRALRTDPYSFESQFSLRRSGRPGRKPLISEIGPRTRRLSKPGDLKIGASPLGPRYGGNSSTIHKRGKPSIYRPWTSFSSKNESLVSTVYNAHKTLVENDDNGDFGYKESLVRFVRHLGPTARRVASMKLIKCLPQEAAPTSSSRMSQRLLLPSPPFFPHKSSASAYNNNYSNNNNNNLQSPPNNIAASNVAYNGNINTLINLKVQASVERAGNSYYSSGTGIIKIRQPSSSTTTTTSAADHRDYGGRLLKMINNNLMLNIPPKEPNHDPSIIDHHHHQLRKMPIIFDNTKYPYNFKHKMTEPLQTNDKYLVNVNFGSGSSSTGNYALNCPSDIILHPNMAAGINYFPGNIKNNILLRENANAAGASQRQIVDDDNNKNNKQNRQLQVKLASHFRVIPVDDIHGSPKFKFRTVDMLAEAANNSDNNNNTNDNYYQKGKQVGEVLFSQQHQGSSSDHIDHHQQQQQLSLDWKSRLRDFVNRSNIFLKSTSPEDQRKISFLSSSLTPTNSTTTYTTTTTNQVGLAGDGLIGWPSVGGAGPGNHVASSNVEMGNSSSTNGFSSLQMLMNNYDHGDGDDDGESFNQLSYASVNQRMGLQPQPAASSPAHFGTLLPMSYNEGGIGHNEEYPSTITGATANQGDQVLLSLNDTDHQLPDLALQL